MLIKFIKTAFLLLLIQASFASDSLEFKTRVSFLNFGLDYTKYFNVDEMYRSIFLVPIMLERKNFEIGLYISPFIKEKYDSFGNYQYDKFMNSYLLNLRFRYLRRFENNINTFIDLAYCDERLYSDKYLYWLELGFIYRISPLIKILSGYKKSLYTANNLIDVDSFFINFIIGHSFLRRN